MAVEAHKQKFIDTDAVDSLSAQDADKQRPFGSAIWGANSRARAIRARKLLGWSPHGKKLDEEIPEQVQIEAKLAGLVQGHAVEAAG